MTSLPSEFVARTGPWSGPVTLLIRPKPVATKVPTVDAFAVAPLASPEAAIVVRPADEGFSMREFGNAFGYMKVYAVDVPGLLDYAIPHTGENLHEMLPAVLMRKLSGERSLFHTTSILDINVTDEQALMSVRLHASALALLLTTPSPAPVLEGLLSRLSSLVAARYGRIPVSVDTLSQLLTDLDNDMARQTAQLRELAGETISTTSPGQVTAFFTRRGYVSPLKTEKGAPSWSEEALLRYPGVLPPEVALVRDIRATQNAVSQAKKLRESMRFAQEAVQPRWSFLSEKGHLSPSSSSPAFNFLSARVRDVFCRAGSVWFGVQWPDTFGMLAWATGARFDLSGSPLGFSFDAVPEDRRLPAMRATALAYLSEPSITADRLGVEPALVHDALQACETRPGLLNEVLGLIPTKRTATSLGYVPPASTTGVPPLVRLMECERSEQMYKLAVSLFETDAPIHAAAFSDHSLYLMVPQHAADAFYARHIAGSLALDGAAVVTVSVGRSPGALRSLSDPGAMVAAGLL
jgi:hypothetical protein